jgi:hypothetical protein
VPHQTYNYAFHQSDSIVRLFIWALLLQIQRLKNDIRAEERESLFAGNDTDFKRAPETINEGEEEKSSRNASRRGSIESNFTDVTAAKVPEEKKYNLHFKTGNSGASDSKHSEDSKESKGRPYVDEKGVAAKPLPKVPSSKSSDTREDQPLSPSLLPAKGILGKMGVSQRDLEDFRSVINTAKELQIGSRRGSVVCQTTERQPLSPARNPRINNPLFSTEQSRETIIDTLQPAENSGGAVELAAIHDFTLSAPPGKAVSDDNTDDSKSTDR